ncbi:MAG TPA: hypothetical protein VFM23_08215 [Gemmatimonadales bacterium]|nr:hypothetical protein [Gemmatimonadales bacterium]
MADSRIRIVIAYAIWAGICAVVAGVVMAIIHTQFFSYIPSRTAFMSTLLGGIATTSAIAAGQAAVILATGSLLAQRGYTLQGTVLLGLLVGAFDFLMNLLQLIVPALEPGWTWDLVILAVATVGITLLGARRATATA